MLETVGSNAPGEPVCANIALAGLGRDGASIVYRLDALPDVVRRLYLTSSPTRAVASSPGLLHIRAHDAQGDEFRTALAGAEMLVLVATVVDGEGALAPEVIEAGRRHGALVVAVLVEPLLTGAPRRTEATERVVSSVIRAADATVLVPADLQAAAVLSVNEAVDKWTRRLTATLNGLLYTAAAEDAMNIHMTDIAATLSKHCRATVGVGEASTVESALGEATKNCLASPAEVESARSVLAHVVASGDIPLDEARRAVGAIEHRFPKADVCCGVSIREGVEGVTATVIAAKLDAAANPVREKRRHLNAELPFFKVGDPTVYDGVHLDVPAFIRKDVTLPGTPPRPVPAQTTLFDKPAPVSG